MNKLPPSDHNYLFDDPMLDKSMPDPDADYLDDNYIDESGSSGGSTARTPQQTQYAEKARLRAEVIQQCNDAVRGVLEKLAQANPALVKYGIRPQNRLYRKRPPGFSKVVPAIAERLTRKGWATDKTQAEILADVQANLPDYPELISPNIWATPMPPNVLKRIQDRFKGSLYSAVDLRGCASLSEIKEAVRAAEKLESAEQVFQGTIAILSDAVIIHGTVYRIEQRKSGKYSYSCIRLTIDGKRQWMSLAALTAVLHLN